MIFVPSNNFLFVYILCVVIATVWLIGFISSSYFFVWFVWPKNFLIEGARYTLLPSALHRFYPFPSTSIPSSLPHFPVYILFPPYHPPFLIFPLPYSSDPPPLLLFPFLTLPFIPSSVFTLLSSHSSLPHSPVPTMYLFNFKSTLIFHIIK